MINLVHLGDYDPERHFNWPFVYADGAAEDLCDEKSNKVHTEAQWEAPDLVCGDRPYKDLGPGIHPVLLYGQPAKAYLYRFANGFTHGVVGNGPLLDGMIVLDAEPERQAFRAAWREAGGARTSLSYWDWYDDMVEMGFAPDKIASRANVEARHAPEFDRAVAEALLDRHDPGWRERRTRDEAEDGTED